MKGFQKFRASTSGASAVEYALILALIGAAIAISSIVLGQVVGSEMNSTANCISGQDLC